MSAAIDSVSSERSSGGVILLHPFSVASGYMAGFKDCSAACAAYGSTRADAWMVSAMPSMAQPFLSERNR